MAATVTAFYTFVAGTPANAAEVNNNFSQFRGTIVPVTENTQTASNLTNDLGSIDHRWYRGYISELYLGNTQSSFVIKDQSPTVGNMSFEINGGAFYRMNFGLFQFLNTAGSIAIWELASGALTLKNPSNGNNSWRVGSNNMTYYNSAGSSVFSVDASGTMQILDYTSGAVRFEVANTGTVNGAIMHSRNPGSITVALAPTTTETNSALFNLSIAAGSYPNANYLLGFTSQVAGTQTTMLISGSATSNFFMEFIFRHETTTGSVVYRQRWQTQISAISSVASAELPASMWNQFISQLTTGSFTLKFSYMASHTITMNNILPFARRFV